MRRAVICLILCCSAFAVAGPELGTKPEPLGVNSSPAGSAVGVMPIVQMLVALGIVYAVIRFVLPKVVGKIGKKLTPSLGSSLRIEDSATFPGGSLYVVKARSKVLLLSVSTHGTSLLAELTEEPTSAEELTFTEHLELVEEATPSEAIIEPAPHVELALERLRKLAG